MSSRWRPSRRLRLVGAPLLALSLVAAACGSDDDSSSDTTTVVSSAAPGSSTGSSAPASTTSTAPKDVDPAGVLRVASTLTGMDLQLDADSSWGTSRVDGILANLFGTLLRLEPDGTITPWLAKSYTVTDPTTVSVTLRDGVTFHDGSPYLAQTVADAILNYKKLQDAGNNGWRETALGNITAIEVSGTTGLTFRLNAPVAGLLVSSLASRMSYVAAPTSTPPNKVFGAGPFQLKSFTPLNRIIVEKYPKFFDADKYLLAGVEWLEIPQIQAATSALQAGGVDLVAVNPGDLDPLVRGGKYKGLITNNQGSLMLATCTSKPPLDNARFREAFDLALNRKQLAQLVFAGTAQPMESLWNPDSPLNIKGLIDTDGDQERARQILKEINWDANTEVPIGVAPALQTHILLAETISGQLAQVGIKSKVVPMQGGDITKYTTLGGVHVIGNVNQGVGSVSVPGRGASVTWNPCAYNDPTLNGMLDKLSAGDIYARDLAPVWKQVQETVTSQRLWYPLVTQPSVYAYDAGRVAGMREGTIGLTGATQPSPFLDGVYIKTR